MDRASMFEGRTARSQSTSVSPTHKSPGTSPLKRGGKGGTFKSSFRGAAQVKCDVCTKSVYPVEKIEADGRWYVTPRTLASQAISSATCCVIDL